MNPLAWIGTFFSLLMAVSDTARNLVAAGFDEIREHLTVKTTTKLDDAFVNILEAIVLGQYQTTGTGQMEAFIDYLQGKVTPEVRAFMREKLLELREKLVANETDGDEKAVDFLLTVLGLEEVPA